MGRPLKTATACLYDGSGGVHDPTWVDARRATRRRSPRRIAPESSAAPTRRLLAPDSLPGVLGVGGRCLVTSKDGTPETLPPSGAGGTRGQPGRSTGSIESTRCSARLYYRVAADAPGQAAPKEPCCANSRGCKSSRRCDAGRRGRACNADADCKGGGACAIIKTLQHQARSRRFRRLTDARGLRGGANHGHSPRDRLPRSTEVQPTRHADDTGSLSCASRAGVAPPLGVCLNDELSAPGADACPSGRFVTEVESSRLERRGTSHKSGPDAASAEA